VCVYHYAKPLADLQEQIAEKKTDLLISELIEKWQYRGLQMQCDTKLNSCHTKFLVIRLNSSCIALVEGALVYTEVHGLFASCRHACSLNDYVSMASEFGVHFDSDSFRSLSVYSLRVFTSELRCRFSCKM